LSSPVINDTTVDQTATINDPDILYDVNTAFKEYSISALTFTATLQNGSALPAWISFNDIKNVFSISTATISEAMVIITAENHNSLTKSQTFKAQITHSSPVINNDPADISKWENITFSHDIDLSDVFTDQDPSQTLTFSVPYKPTWLTESWTGDIVTLSANAPYSDIGDHNVILKATNSYDFAVCNLTITIQENDPPAAPTTLQTTINSLEGINASTTFAAFTDTESNAVTYSMTYNDGTTPINLTWITFDPTTRVLNYLPTASQSTPQIFKFIATDNHNPEVSEDITFTINYAPKDNPAVISRTRNFIYQQNTTVIISRHIITDDDTIVNYALTFANGTTAPSWISMTLWTVSASGHFEFDGTYTSFQAQLYEFTITATDSNGLTGTANFFISTMCKYK
jgi:hypothetical protein